MESPKTRTLSSDLTEKEINQLFEEYLPKLVRLAEHRISVKYGAKFDGEDIAGSTCRTVFRRLQAGSFRFDDDAEFWRLLVTVAKRKICNRVRDSNAQKRSIDLEVSDVASTILSAPDPDPAEAVAFEESLDILAGRLDSEEREIFRLRMEGHEYHEIANLVGFCERTVRRKMDVVRSRLTVLFDVPASP